MTVEAGKRYLLGEFELETGKRLLTRKGQVVRLAHRPFQVLVHLIENRERLVTRQELLDLFWEGRDVYDMTLSRCVSSIRKALDDRSDRARFIETRWAEGYRFIGPIEEHPAADSPSWEIERVHGFKIVVHDDENAALIEPSEKLVLLGDVVRPAEAKTAAPTLIAPTRRVPSRIVFFTLLVAFIALTIGGIWFYRHRTHAASTAPESIRSIAVLPLRNLSGDPTNEYFSDGMTESLITALSRIDNLRVISRSSVFRFKNKEITPGDVGKNLGVAAVLEGSVRNIGNSVRIDVRLVSAEDGSVLWTGGEHDHALGNLFALQDEIARNVAAALKLRLSGDDERKLARRYTDNVEAYQLYLQGRSYWNNYSAEQDLLRAIQYFQAAAAKDPNYALAYSGLADAYITLALDWRNPKEVMPKAQEYARKALELDDKLGEAHHSRGAVAYFYEWNWELAQKELDRSLELNAKSLESNVCYLHSVGSMRQPEDAMVTVRRAMDQNPLSVFIESELSCASYYARRYDEAVDFSQDTLRMDRGFMLAHYNAARALGQKQMYEQAITELNKAAEIGGNSGMIVAELGYDYASSGRKEEARKLLDELQTRSAHEFIDPYPLAFIYVALGDHDKALASLEKAYDARSTWMPWIRVEPKFDSLRSEPRFAALLKRLANQKASLGNGLQNQQSAIENDRCPRRDSTPNQQIMGRAALTV